MIDYKCSNIFYHYAVCTSLKVGPSQQDEWHWIQLQIPACCSCTFSAQDCPSLQAAATAGRAAGWGRRTGRRTIRSECVSFSPPPSTPASGWGQTYALHKFPALRNAPDVSIFFSLRTNPAYFQVDFRTANFSLGGTLFHHTKSKRAFGKHVYIYASK